MTTRQKNIIKIIDDFREGWMSEADLESSLEKQFTDKRHKPRKK